MSGTFLKSLTLAAFTLAAVPMVAQADHRVDHDLGEPRYETHFDCKDIQTRAEWQACWNKPDQ